MTRRIAVAIIATVVATLALAGATTLALATVRSRAATEEELRTQSADLAAAIGALYQARPGTDTTAPVAFVQALRKALRLEGFEILIYGPNGNTRDTLPPGVSEDDVDLERLRAGETLSGNNGSLVWAASPVTVQRGALAVAVATRQAGSGLRPAFGWFFLAAGITIALATAVAVLLGRRLSRPVREADAAARRIAHGDLTVRLPEPPARHDDELAELARSINAMAVNLERSKALEQQFLLSVSHDLRTPLTSIKGYADAITDSATKDPQWAAGVIKAEALRLERLVRDLLELATLQARSFSLQLGALDASAVAAAGVEGLQPEAEAAGLRLTVDAPVPVGATADPDRLRQVVANLVENAIKYATSAVVVSVRANASGVEVLVDDDGPGIAPSDQPHVFERLYVARHQPARKESGSGLGLAIVRELVVAMGGSVEAAGAPGGGARIVVRLPRAPLPVARAGTLPPPVSASGR